MGTGIQTDSVMHPRIIYGSCKGHSTNGSVTLRARIVHVIHLTSFHMNRVHCDWSQPQRTGSLHNTQLSLLWLWPITMHSVRMKWGQSVEMRSDEVRWDKWYEHSLIQWHLQDEHKLKNFHSSLMSIIQPYITAKVVICLFCYKSSHQTTSYLSTCDVVQLDWRIIAGHCNCWCWITTSQKPCTLLLVLLNTGG